MKICPYCGEKPHAMKDCPGCQGSDKTRQMLLDTRAYLATALRDSQRLDKLAQAAPVALWRGSKADGTPMFQILATDDDGILQWSLAEDAIVRGSGTDIRAAIDAMEDTP